MDISESGNLLITGSDDRTARVWDLVNFELKVRKITPLYPKEFYNVQSLSFTKEVFNNRHLIMNAQGVRR